MASADFLQFVVTAACELNLPPPARPPLVLTRSFSPCNCLIYWRRFRTAIGRKVVWHPCPRRLPYEIPVRQFRDLPPPSFRFHLAMDTLGFGYDLPTAGWSRDFHPLERALAGRTYEKTEHFRVIPKCPAFIT